MNRLLAALGVMCGLICLTSVGAHGEDLTINSPELDSQPDAFTYRSIRVDSIPLLDLSSQAPVDDSGNAQPENSAIPRAPHFLAADQFLTRSEEPESAAAESETFAAQDASDDVRADDIANGAPTEASRRAIRPFSGETTTPDRTPVESQRLESEFSAPALGAGNTSRLAISPETEQRLLKVRRVLEVYRLKLLNTRDHGPWETMHAIVAFGVDTKVRRNGPTGEPVTAIGWLAFNNPAAGQKLFYARREGGLGALMGPGLQGHSGQFLAIVAQGRLDRSYPIQADGKKFTIEDLIRYEQDTCQAKTELTFKLISLAHYLDSDATWKNEYGEDWNIQRLIREELAQPINGVACGGTHRLFGLSYAVFQRARQGKPMVGEFARAKKFIHDYHQYTYALQNSDGSFSTNWFKGREARYDLDRRLQTTGHILEWMVFSSPREDLQNPRITKAVDYLADIMLANSTHDWPIGPLGHAIHAMALYDMRLSPAEQGVLPLANRVGLSK
jgi:hypothetical protein